MDKSRISTLQFTFIIIQTQIGVGILGLPFQVQSEAKGDSWISILIAGMIVQLVVFLMWLLGRKFPQQTFFEYTPRIIGKFLGKTLNVLYSIYGILVVSLILISFSSIVKSWVLLRTPKWAILLLLVLTAVYLAKGTIEEISNFQVLVSILIPLLLVLSISVLFTYTVDFRYLLPVGQAGIKGILKGANTTYIAMLGFEMMLLVYPAVKADKDTKILKSASIAIWSVTLSYSILTVICLVIFSPEEIHIVPQPVLYLVKSLYLQVIERVDLLFLSLWMVNVTTSIISYLYFSSAGLMSLKRKWNRTYVLIAAASISFFIALIPTTKAQIEIYNKAFINISYIFILVLPMLLLLLTYIFKKGTKLNEN